MLHRCIGAMVTALAGYQSQASLIVYLASAAMLVVMAVLIASTGARTVLIHYKIYPVVKTVVVELFILGSLL